MSGWDFVGWLLATYLFLFLPPLLIVWIVIMNSVLGTMVGRR